MLETSKDLLKKIYLPRPLESRKYDFGLLLIIGGSDFYSGSPALSALSAFKAGADMVRVIAPKRSADIIASFGPIMAAYPLEGSSLDSSHMAVLDSMTQSAKAVSNGKTAVVIGGGVGRSNETQKVILDYLERVDAPVVIDADAIHALKDHSLAIEGRPFVITPHTYEFYILTGREIYQKPLEEKIKMVQEEAERLKTTILLKGPVDIISNGKEVALNKTGCSYMTKGGMGDTLAGITGAYLARGVESFLSAQAASYVNGLAGEVASKKHKESTTAMDLIESIEEVIQK